MKPATEKLLQVAALLAVFYYGWIGVVSLVVKIYNGQMAEGSLAMCQAELARRPPAAAAPTPEPEKK